MCVCRKNQEQEPNTKPSPAQRLPSPTPFSKNNQEKKFIKISCRNSLKFTVACPECTHRPAPRAPAAPSSGHLGPDPPCPRHRQTDRRQEDAAAASSLNREVKKLNKLKQQINNTDLFGRLLPPGPVPPGPGWTQAESTCGGARRPGASQRQGGRVEVRVGREGRCGGGAEERPEHPRWLPTSRPLRPARPRPGGCTCRGL